MRSFAGQTLQHAGVGTPLEDVRIHVIFSRWGEIFLAGIETSEIYFLFLSLLSSHKLCEKTLNAGEEKEEYSNPIAIAE